MIFTSIESIQAHDWRLMGRTSLLMFPIYGCGALLAPIGAFADRWIGEDPLRSSDRYIRHGMLYMVLIFAAEYFSGSWLKDRGMCPWDYSGRQTSINGLTKAGQAEKAAGFQQILEELRVMYANRHV